MALGTEAIEKLIPDWFAQAAVGPLMVEIEPTAGFASTVIAWQLGKLTPQALPAVTHTVSEALPKEIVTVRVPCPAVIVPVEVVDHV